jgi:hypothetical protein
MYTSRVEKILKGLSKNLSVHNVPFHPIFVFILIKNHFITHISSIKSLLLNIYKILFHSLYRQKLSFKLYRFYQSSYICLFKRFTLSDCLHSILNIHVFLKIKGRSVFFFIADFLNIILTFLFKKPETEFNSSSFMLSASVTKFNSCRTKQFTLSSNCNLPCSFRVFPASGVLSNNWCNVFLKKILSSLYTVISSIYGKFFYIFSFSRKVFTSRLCKFYKIMPIPFVTFCNFYTNRDRKCSLREFKMNLVAKKAKILRFISPLSIFISIKCFYMRRIYVLLKIFSFNKAYSLSYKIKKYFIKYFLPKFHSKVVKGVMLRSVSIEELTKITEPAIVPEFSCKFSFRRSITQINKEQSFKEALRIKSLSATLKVFVFAKFIDEGKINAFKNYFKGVIGRNHICNCKVSKRRLNSFSHILNYSVDKFKYFNTLRMFAVIGKNNGLQKFDFQTSVSF